MSLPERTSPYPRTRARSGAPAIDGPAPGTGDCADSRYGFGILTLQSATDPQAISEALHWIESAAKQGHAGAEELLRKMAAA